MKGIYFKSMNDTNNINIKLNKNKNINKKRAKIYIVFLVELIKVKDLHLGRKNVKPGSGSRRFQGKMCAS